MGPKVKTITNAATPVATSFAQYLWGQLSPTGPLQMSSDPMSRLSAMRPNSMLGRLGRTALEGVPQTPSSTGIFGGPTEFGAGVGRASQTATRGIENFVEAASRAIGTGGADPGTMAMIQALSDVYNTQTARQAADMRESFGMAGSRFGSPLAQGEALLRAEAQRNLGALTSQALAARQAQNEANLMVALELLQRQGQINIAPFLAAMGIGIPQAESIVSPSIGQQILAGLLSAGGQLAGGYGLSRGLRGGFGD